VIRLRTATPAMPIRQIDGAVTFYREKLGFLVVHQDPGLAVLRRDAAVLHLWLADDETWQQRESFEHPIRTGAESFIAGTASCRVATEGLDELYADLKANEVLHPTSADRITETDFGTREFSVLDQDGNLLTFFTEVGAGSLGSRA
jgi:catechol 2,3-dioxygenase-like lactoylglutathione lyase family enzyme